MYSFSALLFFLIFFLFSFFLLPFFFRKAEELNLKVYCKKNNILVLTYDDGPGKHLTPELLKIFEHHRVKATFFMLGMRAERNPNIVQEIKNNGYEIGFHGQNHLNYWKVAPWRSLHDLKLGLQQLSEYMEDRKIFRPPYGKITLLHWIYLKVKKIQVGWWTFPVGDTSSNLQSIDDIVSAIIRNNGGVILLHDFDRKDTEKNRYVIDLTENIIKEAKRNQWHIMCLGDVLNNIKKKQE